MKINPQEEQEEIKGETTIDNKLEILKFASQVQSRIKKDISEDFILAKLEEKDKEGITEMTSNAYFAKKILLILKEKATKWNWNEKTKTWTNKPLNNEEKEFIKQIANTTFDSYLTRIYMTVILNRNVPQNHILKILAGVNEEEPETQVEPQTIKEKIKTMIQPEQTQ